MGVTKTEFYTTEQIQLARIAKVLGHPARIAIVQQVIAAQGCICNDLVATIGLAQPTISQHLKELKQADIIQGKIEGSSICYCLNTQTWSKIANTFATLFDTDDKQCC